MYILGASFEARSLVPPDMGYTPQVLSEPQENVKISVGATSITPRSFTEQTYCSKKSLKENVKRQVGSNRSAENKNWREVYGFKKKNRQES